MNKHDVLVATTFGSGTAEGDEALRESFVETDIWADVFNGRVDFVYGPKGAGKSAIYSLLFAKQDELRKRGVVMVGAENLHGDPVFLNLPQASALTEEQFIRLWKLYFLSLVGYTLRSLKLKGDDAGRVVKALEEEGLLPKDYSLAGALQAALRYLHVELALQPPTPVMVASPITVKITFQEPSDEQRSQGQVSVHNLFQLAGSALARAKLTLWLAIDRLDVAFASDEALESKALRALLRTSRDLKAPAYRLSTKIFLRTDIWDRITGRRSSGSAEKLPEANAFEGAVIKWNDTALMNLIVRRILYNKKLCAMYKVDPSKVRSDFEQQKALFYRIFPKQMLSGPKQTDTFQWLLSRTKDGTGQAAPRELVLLLRFARESQLESMGLGTAKLPGEALFDGASLEDAASRLSEFRLYQTLYTEYPKLKRQIERLRGGQPENTVERLAQIWRASRTEDARRIADQLVYIGLFEERRTGTARVYHVPPLYQPALRLTSKVSA